MDRLAIIVFALIFTVVSAKPHSHEHIKRINSVQTSWKAGYTKFASLREEEFKRLLGAKLPSNLHTLKRKHVDIANDIPESFDARDQWPQCASISSIKDQGDCGGCWAVAGASAASDRLCIGSEFKIQVNLSAENLLTCCSECAPQGGCNGGDSQLAWKYIQESGIVTGGDYQSAEGCQPYGIAPSDDDTPPCTTTCTNTDYDIPYEDDLHYGDSYYVLPNDVSQIQTDIINYGPVEGSFDVYDDFQYYESGVYARTTEKTDGTSHAVRIIGWGHDQASGLDYWLIANSWSRSFGENGLFRIKRGSNECGIEDYVVAGQINA